MTWAKIDELLYFADNSTSSLYATRLIADLADTAATCFPSTGFAWPASNRPVISTAPGFTRGPLWLHRVDPYCVTMKTAILYEVANGAAAAGADGVRARLRVGDLVGAWSTLNVTSVATVVTLSCALTAGQVARVVTVQVEVESKIGADVGAATIGVDGTGAYQPHVHIDVTGLTAGKSHYALGFAVAAYGDTSTGIQWHHVGRIIDHTHGGGNDSIGYIWPYIADTEAMFGADQSKTDTAYFRHVGRMTFHARATWCKGNAAVVPPIDASVAYSRAPIRPSDLWLLHRQTMQLRSWRARIWGSGAQSEDTTPPNLFGSRVGASEVAASCVPIRRPNTTGMQVWALVVPLRASATQAKLIFQMLDVDRTSLADDSVDFASRPGVLPAREIDDDGSETLYNLAAGNDPTTWGQADASGANDAIGDTGQPVLVSITLDWPVGVSDGDAVVCQLATSTTALHVIDAMFAEVY